VFVGVTKSGVLQLVHKLSALLQAEQGEVQGWQTSEIFNFPLGQRYPVG
jgi:hypothetical protein